MKTTGEMITLMKMKACLTHHRREDFMKIMALIQVSLFTGVIIKGAYMTRDAKSITKRSSHFRSSD